MSVPQHFVDTLMIAEMLAQEASEYFSRPGPSSRFITVLAGNGSISLRNLNDLAAIENFKRITVIFEDVARSVSAKSGSTTVTVRNERSGDLAVVLEDAGGRGQVTALRANAYRDDVNGFDTDALAEVFLALRRTGPSNIVLLSDVLDRVRGPIAVLENLTGALLRVRRWPAGVSAMQVFAAGAIEESDHVLRFVGNRLILEKSPSDPEEPTTKLSLILQKKREFDLSAYRLAKPGDLDVLLSDGMENVAVSAPAR